MRDCGNKYHRSTTIICPASRYLRMQWYVYQKTLTCGLYLMPRVVPFRLLSWISSCLSVISVLSSKQATTSECLPAGCNQFDTDMRPSDHDAELAIISSQIAQALSIIQGTALIHAGTKRYLGRRYPLEVCMDVFLRNKD